MIRPFLITILLLALAACTEDAETHLTEKPAGESALPEGLCVWEYTPAPGQFIGDTSLGGMTEPITTAAEAVVWADGRISGGRFVSLGGFGGYIVVSLGRAITDGVGNDFAIAGNAFVNGTSGQSSSNEPGIVFVMTDTNGNGLPDDTWYELAGSRSLDYGTIRNYSVTYFRPSEPKQPVKWTDSRGKEGEIDHITLLHRQDTYYPSWIHSDSYTLTGTCLPAQTALADDGRWSNAPFEWGYADNMGSDVVDDGEGGMPWVGFDLSRAILPDGTPAVVNKVHFIKVQTGVNSKAGPLGEVSTEVCGFRIL